MDFHGISISPAISKVLVHCIIERFSEFLNTTDNQLDSKSNSIVLMEYTLYQNVLDHFISGGFTVNVCSLDLFKAFDEMSHYALYIKLINRNILLPCLRLLKIFGNWFNISYTCDRWGRPSSNFLSLLQVLGRKVFYHQGYLLFLLMTCHKKLTLVRSQLSYIFFAMR